MSNWYEFKASASGEETEILLYGEIGSFGITAESFVATLKQVPANHRINLRIYSPGGSVLDGNVIYSAIQRHPGGVVTHIDGLAASMASVIALAGKPVKMASNALYMIHNVSGWASGDPDDLRKTADMMEKVQDTVVAAYVSKTGMSKKEIKDMMDEETWMSAKEAKAKGFVDEITTEKQMAASFDLSKFRKPPTQIDNQTNSMTIETPEFLALQAEHKTTCELATTLKTDLEAKTADVTSLSAKLSEANTKLQDADKAITELTASLEKAAAEHAAALSDFDKKVADKAALLLAASGTPAVNLGSSDAGESDAALYDTFKKADPITSKTMLEDPATGARIRRESARRHQ